MSDVRCQSSTVHPKIAIAMHTRYPFFTIEIIATGLMHQRVLIIRVLTCGYLLTLLTTTVFFWGGTGLRQPPLSPNSEGLLVGVPTAFLLRFPRGVRGPPPPPRSHNRSEGVLPPERIMSFLRVGACVGMPLCPAPRPEIGLWGIALGDSFGR